MQLTLFNTRYFGVALKGTYCFAKIHIVIISVLYNSANRMICRFGAYYLQVRQR